MPDDTVPITTSKEVLKEALDLSEEIMRNIELNELPLSNVALKTLRLARLLNDFEFQKIFQYEASGYPSTPTGVPMDIFDLGRMAGRWYQEKSTSSDEIKQYIYVESIESLEQTLETSRIRLEAASDPDTSISSANPNQIVWAPKGNVYERKGIVDTIAQVSKRLSSRRAFIYSYVQAKHYELKFSGVAGDTFSRARENVDRKIGEIIPDAVQKFTAVYDNLQSENPEDWSNAVHGCRRIIISLADVLFPAQDEPRVKGEGKGAMTIDLGPGNYVNRLMCYVEDQVHSASFVGVVGSHMDYLGHRLDTIVDAAQKGTHEEIVSREEADRYVVYTYMIVGDILSLVPDAMFKTEPIAEQLPEDEPHPESSQEQPDSDNS